MSTRETVLERSGYRALIRPDMGANCVSLTHAPTGASVLRSPDNARGFYDSRYLYGMPLLFPPNRVRDGAYEYGGVKYEFPINEPGRNHHIHGVLAETPFDVIESTKSRAVFEYRATPEKPYLSFPHAFHIQIEYSLLESGLEQTLTVTNDSASPMPLGVGFHTTFNVPFLPGARAEDVYLRVTAGSVYEFDERIIPTGRTRDAGGYIKGTRACGRPISELVSMRAGDNAAYITDAARGVFIKYTVDSNYKYWMLFNKGGSSGFICAEPQSWIVDAPNLGWDAGITGFCALAPGKARAFKACISVGTL